MDGGGGNEGDAILLLALRQIDSPIGDDITGVGQLTPELLVDIVARCLWLMSEGELKVRILPVCAESFRFNAVSFDICL
jgi:hypothetical protein